MAPTRSCFLVLAALFLVLLADTSVGKSAKLENEDKQILVEGKYKQDDAAIPTLIGGDIDIDCPAKCSSCASCPQCSNILPCPSADACTERIPEGYKYYSGPGYVGYYKYHNIPMKWHDAVAVCQRDGGYLAIPNSAGEVALFNSLNKEREEFIPVGIHDQFKSRDFNTILDQTLAQAGFEQWDDDEPNTVTNRCASVRLSVNKLSDLDCNLEKMFICERPL